MRKQKLWQYLPTIIALCQHLNSPLEPVSTEIIRDAAERRVGLNSKPRVL